MDKGIMYKELKKQILLENLNDNEIEKVSRYIERVKFKKDESVFKEKDVTLGLYMINKGKVEISKVTPDGWSQTLAVLTPNHFFGELSILERRQHEALAVARENTEIFLINKECFENMEIESPAIAFKIIKKIALVMCKNIRRMNDKFLNALISY
jgi:CRP-like cAMP-binding protein